MTLTPTLWEHIMAGNYGEFFIVLFNQYFPYGSFFWIIGLTIFVVIHLKTKDLTYSGMIASVYFVVMGSSGLIINAYSASTMKYFGIILGIIIGWYLYRAFKGEK